MSRRHIPAPQEKYIVAAIIDRHVAENIVHHINRHYKSIIETRFIAFFSCASYKSEIGLNIRRDKLRLYKTDINNICKQMNNSKKPYEFLEHTADIKIRAYGKNLKELFINSALGMMDFLYEDEKVVITHHEKIEVSGDNVELLLINWLSELLWRSDTFNRAYKEYDIQEISEKKIITTVGSGAAKAKDDIKAVTYHELQVTKTKNGFTSIVVYDI